MTEYGKKHFIKSVHKLLKSTRNALEKLQDRVPTGVEADTDEDSSDHPLGELFADTVSGPMVIKERLNNLVLQLANNPAGMRYFIYNIRQNMQFSQRKHYLFIH